MNRFALGLLTALAVSGCSSHERRTIDQVQPGMSREQVVGLMGQPEGQVRMNDRDCAVYVVQKDFWKRTPWAMTDRYHVCYAGNQVETFGRSTASS